jgi:uncharacterized protein YicC (UPF0701 family)
MKMTQIKVVIEESLNNIMTFRRDEGVSLEKNFNCVLGIFDSTWLNFSIGSERSSYKDRLQTAIDELKVNVDENRFEQELIYYLEKLDITKKSAFNKSPRLFLEE